MWRHRTRQAVAWTVRDLRWGSRLWLVNDVAGHRLVPRLLRHLLYRSAGVDVQALDVSSGVTITGGPRLHVGPDTFINHGAYLEAAGGITIGRGCAIGPGAMILSTSHPVDRTGWSDDLVHKETIIGDRVWIAARVMILPGSEIPSGSVIAAGAVVRGRFVETGVYAGNPARLVSRLRPVDLDPPTA